MRPDAEAEKLVAAWYLRDKMESILASTVQPHHFRALARVSPMWRHAFDASDAGRDWLPMDFDRDGYLDQALEGVQPAESMVRIAERRMTEASALVEFRENMQRVLGAMDKLDARELSGEARRIVGELEASGPVKVETFAEVGKRQAERFIRAINEPETALRTVPMPTPIMNEALGGWRRGKLHLVGAITSSHKTTFARMAVEVAAKAGQRCLYWTAEDSNGDIANRTLARNIKPLKVSMLETMDASDLDEDQRRAVMREFVRVLDGEWGERIRMVDLANPTLSQVVGVIRQQAARPLDLVVFDFLQRIKRDPRMDTTEHWDTATAELRELAKALDIAIVCPVQPTQEGTKRVEGDGKAPGKPLRIGDLRGGQSIAANSYGVLTLFVDDDGSQRDLEVHVRKWKGRGKVKFRLWVSGASDDMGDKS